MLSCAFCIRAQLAMPSVGTFRGGRRVSRGESELRSDGKLKACPTSAGALDDRDGFRAGPKRREAVLVGPPLVEFTDQTSKLRNYCAGVAGGRLNTSLEGVHFVIRPRVVSPEKMFPFESITK